MDHGTIPFVCEIQPNIVLVMCFVKGNKEGALLSEIVRGRTFRIDLNHSENVGNGEDQRSEKSG